MNNIIEKIFTGEQKYTIGMLFMFTNIAGFFLNMRKIKVNDSISIAILIIFTIIARCVI